MSKQINFNNNSGEQITGILKEKNTSSPLIIVCHGYKSSQNHPAIESITDKLYEMGHATFAFNFSKSGQGANLIQQVSDINDIVNHLKKNSRKIIILAGSFGALSGAIAAIQSPAITGLITVNGFFGSKKLGNYLLREYFLFRTISFFHKAYRDSWKFLKKEYIPEKLKVSTLVLHARNDKEVLFIQSQEFFKKIAGEKDFFILETADHHLTQESYREEVAQLIDSWMKRRNY